MSPVLVARRSHRAELDDERVAVSTDADVVLARQKGREVAVAAGFAGTELTVIATAISEIARNIVKFAKRGEFVFSVLSDGERTGLQVVARDSGPGIPDVAAPCRMATAPTAGSGWGWREHGG